jgi:hypothetical protein
MTDYERARLRLAAFEIVRGMTVPDENDEPITVGKLTLPATRALSWKETQHWAEHLVTWAET